MSWNLPKYSRPSKKLLHLLTRNMSSRSATAPDHSWITKDVVHFMDAKKGEGVLVYLPSDDQQTKLEAYRDASKQLRDTAYAHLDYNVQSEVMDLHHTWTPPESRGKGIAAILARVAFAHFQDHQVRVSCTYLQDFLEKNPEIPVKRVP